MTPLPPLPATPTKRKLFVTRRTYDAITKPYQKKVPHSAADSAALRAAEMKRRRKNARRLNTLPLVHTPLHEEP